MLPPLHGEETFHSGRHYFINGSIQISFVQMLLVVLLPFSQNMPALFCKPDVHCFSPTFLKCALLQGSGPRKSTGALKLRTFRPRSIEKPYRGPLPTVPSTLQEVPWISASTVALGKIGRSLGDSTVFHTSLMRWDWTRVTISDMTSYWLVANLNQGI